MLNIGKKEYPNSEYVELGMKVYSTSSFSTTYYKHVDGVSTFIQVMKSGDVYKWTRDHQDGYVGHRYRICPDGTYDYNQYYVRL